MKKATLICAYDPLCGWCYGFGPVLLALQEKYADRLAFEVLSGGMITGKSVGPVRNMAAFISGAYPVVEQHSGIKFGSRFLQQLRDGKAIFSSLEPGNVLTVCKELKPGCQVEASHAIQCLIYRDGINPVDYQAYRPLAEQLGLDWRLFSERLNSAETSQLTVHEFSQVHKWGIQGFPACLLETESGKLFGISRGFLPLDEIEKRLSAFPEAGL